MSNEGALGKSLKTKIKEILNKISTCFIQWWMLSIALVVPTFTSVCNRKSKKCKFFYKVQLYYNSNLAFYFISLCSKIHVLLKFAINLKIVNCENHYSMNTLVTFVIGSTPLMWHCIPLTLSDSRWAFKKEEITWVIIFSDKILPPRSNLVPIYPQ